jgi:hypothetical protein
MVDWCMNHVRGRGDARPVEFQAPEFTMGEGIGDLKRHGTQSKVPRAGRSAQAQILLLYAARRVPNERE